MRTMMWARRGAATVALMSAVVATEAAPVTYSFTGKIEGFLTETVPGVNLGAEFAGSFTYDPSSPWTGSGYDALSLVTATVAGLTYESITQPGYTDMIVYDGSSGNADSLTLYTYNGSVSSPYNTGPTIGGYLTPYFLSMVLEDATGQVFSNGGVPEALSLASFNYTRFYFNWLDNYYSQVSAYGSLTSLVLTSAVPEPATWALMLGGLASCLAAARRRGH